MATKSRHQVVRLLGHSLRNRKILITAGPTWVPLDSVRVISNIATGETGVLLAEAFRKRGAKVTLLLGPVSVGSVSRGIRVVPFRYFDELKKILLRELRLHAYHSVIHAAAVSDYEPLRPLSGKIKSNKRKFQLTLKPTVKIIDAIKSIRPASFVVGFKYEPRARKETLVREARVLLRQSRLDLVVANTKDRGVYRAYLVDGAGQQGPWFKKAELARHLITKVKDVI